MFLEFISHVAEHEAKGLPFVMYRKPNENRVYRILQDDDQLHYVQNFSESGFVFAPFDSREAAILLRSDQIKNVEYKIRKSTNTNDEVIVVNDSQKEFHVSMVNEGLLEIEKGAFEKVVLSRAVEATCKSSSLTIFQRLLDTYTTAFCYVWHHPKIGTWVGATPEILLKTENNQFITMSLAGTQTANEDLAPKWGAKELEEQQLVTDYIINALKAKVSGLSLGKLESVRAGQLWHLRTKLTGRIKKAGLAKVIEVLHPTPAVCGLPMTAAKNFILNHEGYEREFYTGFLGELNLKSETDRTKTSRNHEHKAYRAVKNKTTLFVNLRCMQLKKNKALVYVGGGVTKDSSPEKEWEETVAKSKTILRAVYGH